MDTSPATAKYKNHRFPGEIISHAVWLYFRFCLSFRDVEELLFERGVSVTYEAIRKWCRKFGYQYANQLRRRRLHFGYLSEIYQEDWPSAFSSTLPKRSPAFLSWSFTTLSP